jgi:hypothetical protein
MQQKDEYRNLEGNAEYPQKSFSNPGLDGVTGGLESAA